MHILIEPNLFRDALLNRGNSTVNLDEAWNVLASQHYIHGYLSERGLENIRNDVQALNDSSIADQAVKQLLRVLKTCPITATIMGRALRLELDLDLAIEWACAKTYNHDVILTQKPEAFSSAGYTVVSVDELLKGQNVHRFFRSTDLPLIIGGSLQDLPKLEHFARTLLSLKNLSPATQLSPWIDGNYDSQWQPPDELLIAKQQTLSFRRYADPLFSNRRGKPLGSPFDDLALLVGVQSISKQEMDIQIEVCSANQQQVLPSSLEVVILNQEGGIAMETHPHEDESILLELSAEVGEKFDVKLTLGNTSITESFVV